MNSNQNSSGDIQKTNGGFDKYSDVKDSETIFRAIWSRYWKRDGKLSPAAFKDDNGLSVDRDGDRTKEKVISDFRIIRRFQGNMVSIGAKKCRDIEIFLKPNPEYWPYHVLAQDSENVVPISDAKCDQLRFTVRFECEL
jgi:hypothetical protein